MITGLVQAQGAKITASWPKGHQQRPDPYNMPLWWVHESSLPPREQHLIPKPLKIKSFFMSLVLPQPPMDVH